MLIISLLLILSVGPTDARPCTNSDTRNTAGDIVFCLVQIRTRECLSLIPAEISSGTQINAASKSCHGDLSQVVQRSVPLRLTLNNDGCCAVSPPVMNAASEPFGVNTKWVADHASFSQCVNESDASCPIKTNRLNTTYSTVECSR